MKLELLIEEIKNKPLFELYRLRGLIDRVLDDPKRINQIKRNLKVGQRIQYYSNRKDTFVSGKLVALLRNRVRVINEDDGETWIVPISMLKLDGSIDIEEPKRTKVDRLTLKIGEQVGFVSRNGQELYGTVTKLNPKTAQVTLVNGNKWRVAYALLFYILDGECVQYKDSLLIEGEVVQSGTDFTFSLVSVK